LVPSANVPRASVGAIEVTGVERIADALARVFG
jgi:hypothetical protein